MRYQDLSNDQLRRKAREYDDLQNEGGEGYNPYYDELRAGERKFSRLNRKWDIKHQLESLDCMIARESGTYDQTEIDTLRAELDQIEREEKDEFLSVWTPEVFTDRKAEWNAWVRSAGNPTLKKLVDRQTEQGWLLDDLKKAAQYYK
jgi:hypothetical protein